MNIIVWLLVGGLLGWIAYAYLDFNQRRGRVVSILIGATGGFLGGKFVAPMFNAAAAIPDDYSMSSAVYAVVVAAAFLAAGNLLQKRWGV